MLSGTIFILSVLLFAEWTIQTVPQESTIEKNITDEYLKFKQSNFNNSNVTIHWNDIETTLRDKRALGIFLQGIAQALGYNTTPIQIASLPNPNTTGTAAAGPISIDVRSNPPPPSRPQKPGSRAAPAPGTMPVPSPPRQRETLRFTGVVNFGNNSDILGHLRQYERLFHGSTMPPAMMMPPPMTMPPIVTKPPPVTKPPVVTKPPTLPPPTSTTPAPSRPPLLEPYLVPIPIPLAEDLRYPKPLLSIVTTSFPVKTEQLHMNSDQKEKYAIEDEDIRGDRNPRIDEKMKNSKKIIQKNQEREKEINEKNKKIPNVEKDESEDEKDSYENEELNNSNVEDSKEEIEDQRSESEEVTSKEDVEDEGSEKEQVRDEKSNEDSDDSSENQNENLNDNSDENKSSREDPEEYYPQKNLNFAQFPIEDKPLSSPLMNSYGQNLENNGKVDESIADYFNKYKDPNSGLYDRRRIEIPEYERRKYWHPEKESKAPYEKIKNEYPIPGNNKYEEYSIDNDENRPLTRRNRKHKNESSEEVDKKIKTQSKITRKPPKQSQEKTLIAKKDSNRETEEYSSVNQRNSENSKRQNSNSREQSESREDSSERIQKPSTLQTFDFIKHSAYYQPVQYIYSPETLEHISKKILENENLEKSKKIVDKKQQSDESLEDESKESSEKSIAPVRSAVEQVSRTIIKPEIFRPTPLGLIYVVNQSQLNNERPDRLHQQPEYSAELEYDDHEPEATNETPIIQHRRPKDSTDPTFIKNQPEITERPVTLQYHRPEESTEDSEEYYADDESESAQQSPISDREYHDKASEVKYVGNKSETNRLPPLYHAQHHSSPILNKNHEYEQRDTVDLSTIPPEYYHPHQQTNYQESPKNIQIIPEYYQRGNIKYQRPVYYDETRGSTPVQAHHQSRNEKKIVDSAEIDNIEYKKPVYYDETQGSTPVQAHDQYRNEKKLLDNAEIDNPYSTIGYFNIYRNIRKNPEDESEYYSVTEIAYPTTTDSIDRTLLIEENDTTPPVLFHTETKYTKSTNTPKNEKVKINEVRNKVEIIRGTEEKETNLQDPHLNIFGRNF